MPRRTKQAEAYLGEHCEPALGLLSRWCAFQNKVIDTIWSSSHLHVPQAACKGQHLHRCQEKCADKVAHMPWQKGLQR